VNVLQEIDLRVKWPNDIYAGDVKIGGILVESRLEGNQAVVNLGIGVNVSNEFPTVSINSLIKNPKEQFSTEKLIAKVLTELEKLLQVMESGDVDKILYLYTENWIHGCMNDAEEERLVTVEISEGAFTDCSITGIDEFGFLRVTDVTSGHVFSVRPDGNSFDIANRLIAIKE